MLKKSVSAFEVRRVGWKSPSNIAIVKYWGKQSGQLPINPSLSMTLANAVTATVVQYRQKATGEVTYGFQFGGEQKLGFHSKLDNFFCHVFEKYPFLDNYHFDIRSVNSFPHSAGIASSASAMSALALCIEEIAHCESHCLSTFQVADASVLARLGSGSAVRSLHAQWAAWGQCDCLDGANNEVAVSVKNIHPLFASYRDAILLVNEGVKSVSSSAGHQLMNQHPFKAARIAQAHENIKRLTDALTSGCVDLFVEVCEEEALSLHGLMMSSRPGYVLMHPNTLRIIEEVRAFRAQRAIPVAFTLDAGPNVHLLYPAQYGADVERWINERLLAFTVGEKVIYDGVGNGPEKLTEQMMEQFFGNE
jgi:diphosphomevalonate decarboxylase